MEETHEQQPVPNAAAESPVHRSAHSENIMEHVASDLTQTVDELLGSLPERVAEMSGWIGEVADIMAQAVSAAMDRLLGGDAAPGPVDEPLVPYVPVPAAPPPAAPIPVGGPSFAGGSSPSWSLSSAADHEKQIQLFAVLVLFSLALMQGGERRWITHESLTPSMLARPPNERPG